MESTQEQIEVINHRAGHAIVSAVPGSGKTSTMLSRIVRLLSNGVTANEVLVLMFSTAAADDFNTRLRQRISVNQAVPEIRTFHSLGNRLCKRLAKKGYLPDWNLESQEWKLEAMAKSALVMTLAIYGKVEYSKLNEHIEDFISFIGLVKSSLLSPYELFENYNFHQDRQDEYVDAFYIDYEKMGRDMEFSGDVFTVETRYQEVHVFWSH